jgi:hypothetical protein
MIPHAHSAPCGISSGHRLRVRPLVACLALAFSATALADGSWRSMHDLPAYARSRTEHPAAPASAVASVHTHFVTTCDDPPVVPTCDGQEDGTLRKAFSCALNNDTIDLTQLQCSKITLSAPLVSGPVALTLNGPGQEKLTIDAAGTFRALVHKPPLYHNGASLSGLYINNLTITNGRYDNPKNSVGSATGGSAQGGCIYSTGSVFMISSTVSSCRTSSTVRYSYARGGAIFALGSVGLDHSTVTGSTAYSGGTTRYDGSIDAARAYGGGIDANVVELSRSTVSGNMAASKRRGAGGGVTALTVYASYSTISGNTATSIGGIDAFSKAYLSNTTVSDNHAVGINGSNNGFLGGVQAGSAAKLFNCTITGNTSGTSDAAGVGAGSVYLQNTIVANNKAGGVEIDVGDGSGVPMTIAGANNLIKAFPNATVPADTISADPTLGPLQDNGGPTRTHALLPGSPAIDKGGGTGLSHDQSGSPRVIGGKADIGAFEFDPDVVFRTGFN